MPIPTRRHRESQQRIQAMNIIELPARKSNDWITPAELRTLLKANLGLNAKQVSVKQRSSLGYLTITIRDASVNVAAVEQFAKTFDTWSMDMTDYVTGQSIDVTLSDEVRETLAQQTRHLIEACEIPGANQGHEVVPGVMMWNVDNNTWIERRTDRKRSTNVWTRHLATKCESSIKQLAVDLALLTQ